MNQVGVNFGINHIPYCMCTTVPVTVLDRTKQYVGCVTYNIVYRSGYICNPSGVTGWITGYKLPVTSLTLQNMSPSGSDSCNSKRQASMYSL